MKTVSMLYRNKRNERKFLIVHRSSCHHYTVKQLIFFWETLVTNYTGDGCFHRWKKKDLETLLEDYDFISECLK